MMNTEFEVFEEDLILTQGSQTSTPPKTKESLMFLAEKASSPPIFRAKSKSVSPSPRTNMPSLDEHAAPVKHGRKKKQELPFADTATLSFVDMLLEEVQTQRKLIKGKMSNLHGIRDKFMQDTKERQQAAPPKPKKRGRSNKESELNDEIEIEIDEQPASKSKPSSSSEKKSRLADMSVTVEREMVRAKPITAVWRSHRRRKVIQPFMRFREEQLPIITKMHPASSKAAVLDSISSHWKLLSDEEQRAYMDPTGTSPAIAASNPLSAAPASSLASVSKEDDMVLSLLESEKEQQQAETKTKIDSRGLSDEENDGPPVETDTSWEDRVVDGGDASSSESSSSDDEEEEKSD